MSWYLDKSMRQSRVGTEVFLIVATSVCCPLCRLSRKVSFAKRKYISPGPGILYPAPKISDPNLNFKLRWRKILSLAPWNYFPFGDNLDLPWYWIFPEIPLRYSYLFSLLGFTRLLLSWGTTSITKRKTLSTFPLTQSPTTYITYLIIELRVGWKTQPN